MNDLKKHIVLNFINIKIVVGDLGIFGCGLRLVSVDKYPSTGRRVGMNFKLGR